MHLATFKMKTSCGNAFIVQQSLCRQYLCNRGFPPTSLYHAHLKLQRNTSCGIRQTYFTGRFLTKKFGNFPGQYRFFTAQNGSAHLENDIWYVFYSQACIASQLYLFPVVHPWLVLHLLGMGNDQHHGQLDKHWHHMKNLYIVNDETCKYADG